MNFSVNYTHLSILGSKKALVAQEGAPFDLGHGQTLAGELNHSIETRWQRS